MFCNFGGRDGVDYLGSAGTEEPVDGFLCVQSGGRGAACHSRRRGAVRNTYTRTNSTELIMKYVTQSFTASHVILEKQSRSLGSRRTIKKEIMIVSYGMEEEWQ